MDAHANFPYSTISVAPVPASSGLALTVQAGNGALFPAVPFNATVWPAGVAAVSTNAEIVRVTANVADVFTIVRAQESSSARTIVVGDQIAATITKLTLTDIETAIGMQLIQEQLLGSDVATVNFSSIPAPPRRKILRLTEAAISNYAYMQFNGDTGNNYDRQNALWVASATSIQAEFAQPHIRIGELPGASADRSTRVGCIEILVPHYAGSTFDKAAICKGGAQYGTVGNVLSSGHNAGGWRNNAALTSALFRISTGNFKTGSIFSMYGCSMVGDLYPGQSFPAQGSDGGAAPAVPLADRGSQHADVFAHGLRAHRSPRARRKGLVLRFGSIGPPPLPNVLLPSVRKRFDCIARSRSRHRGRERRRDF